MPKILEVDGFKIYIYTDDHIPPHVHVWKGGCEAKILLAQELILKDNYGFKAKELKRILQIIDENFTLIIDKWNEIHNK